MFERETAAVNTAISTFKSEHAKLYINGNGTPMYSPEEQTRRVDALTATLDAVLETAEQTANEAGREAAKVLDPDEQLDHRATAMDRLSEADLTKANARRAFVEEDAKHLHPRELAARARQALESGDRAMAFLLARYGGLRVEAEAAAGRSASSDTITLKNAVDKLWDSFKDPKLPEKRQQAQETRKAASALRQHIWAQRKQATGVDPAMDAARRLVGARF